MRVKLSNPFNDFSELSRPSGMLFSDYARHYAGIGLRQYTQKERTQETQQKVYSNHFVLISLAAQDCRHKESVERPIYIPWRS